MSIKKANKVSSIPRSILLYESIVDIDTSKVASIISTSIFDITNPDNSSIGYTSQSSGDVRISYI